MIQNELQTPRESNRQLNKNNKTKEEASPTPTIMSPPHISKVIDDSTSEQSSSGKKDGLSTRSQSPCKKVAKKENNDKSTEETVAPKEEVAQVF